MTCDQWYKNVILKFVKAVAANTKAGLSIQWSKSRTYVQAFRHVRTLSSGSFLREQERERWPERAEPSEQTPL